MNLLILGPSPLHILIPLGSKYSPQDPDDDDDDDDNNNNNNNSNNNNIRAQKFMHYKFLKIGQKAT